MFDERDPWMVLYKTLTNTAPYTNDKCGGMSSKGHQMFFDGIMHWLFSSVSCKEVDKNKSIYRISIIVPGRTYEFYLRPVSAYMLGRTMVMNKFAREMVGTKRLAIGVEVTSDNVVYIPRWAEASIIKHIDTIVKSNKEQVKSDMSRLNFLARPETTDQQPDVPKSKQELH